MINHDFCRNLREELKAALSATENKHGITITLGSMGFTAEQLTVKLTATVDAPDGTARKPEHLDFERYGFRYGFNPADLGRTFHMQGETYAIDGLSPKAKKYPILGVRADGKRYKFRADDVKRGLV